MSKKTKKTIADDITEAVEKLYKITDYKPKIKIEKLADGIVQRTWDPSDLVKITGEDRRKIVKDVRRYIFSWSKN